MPQRPRTRNSSSARRCLRRSSQISQWATTVGTRSLPTASGGVKLTFPGSVSPLFTDVVQCLGTPLLEIKKSASFQLLHSSAYIALSGLPIPRQLWTVETRSNPPCHPQLSPGTPRTCAFLPSATFNNERQDCNDRNPLIRALAIRTMSYIPIPVVTDALNENLRHCLKDRDPYVRKTAAICVAKLYAADPRRAEKGGFVEMLRDLMLDSNATVVANAVAALSEIGDRQDGVIFKLNLATANKLLAALGESSEYVRFKSVSFPF